MAVPTRNGTAVTSVETSSGLILAYNVQTGTNRCLVSNVIVRDSAAVSGVTFAGNAMTRGPEKQHTTDTLRVVQFYIVNPPTGSGNIVVSLAASVAHRVRAQCYDGVDQANPLHNSNVADGTGSTVTCDVVTSVADCIVVDGFIHEAIDTPTIGGGQTTINNSSEASWASGASDEGAATASTVTMSWTGFNSDTWVQVVGAYKAASGGSSPVGRARSRPLIRA